MAKLLGTSFRQLLVIGLEMNLCGSTLCGDVGRGMGRLEGVSVVTQFGSSGTRLGGRNGDLRWPLPAPASFASSSRAVPAAMARVHPKGVDRRGHGAAACIEGEEPAPEEAASVMLTVWRRSLLFNGNGFAVFDAKGNLAFRVDNYASGSKKEVVLMDGDGKPLLTIRRKKLSLGEQWMIYQGEDDADPRFVVKRHVKALHSGALARITPCDSGANSRRAYKIEGSYSQRRCAVLDDERRPMAEIKRKEPANGVSFGLDVFQLVVQPGFDASVAMTVVMLLEQMFGSRSSSPLIAEN